MIEYPVILEIIEKFYDMAKKDILIGYHFRVIDDFDEHIPKIADFWNLQLNQMMQDRSHLPYDLLGKHRPLKINLGEVHRWMKLFEDNLNDFIHAGQISQEQKEDWIKKADHFKEVIISKLC